MDYNLYYNVAALLILITLSIMMGAKNNIKNKLYRLLLVMLALTVLSIAADTVCLYFPDMYSGLTKTMLSVYMSAYFLAHIGIVLVCCIYVLLLINKEKYTNTYFCLAVIPFLGAVGLVVKNLFDSSLFYFDNDMVYHQGNTAAYLYVIMAVLWAFSFIYTRWNKKSLSKREEMTIYIMIAIQTVCGAIQLLFPWILIENFGYALSLIAVCTGIRNLEEVVDYTTQVYARYAFFENIRARVSEEACTGKIGRKTKDFQLVTIYFTNIQMYLEMIGMKYEDNLLKRCANFFKQTFPKARVYYLGEDAFGMIINKSEYIFSEEDGKKVAEQFENPIVIGNYRIKLEPVILVLDLKPDELSFEDINEYINYGYIKARNSSKDIYYKEDIDLKEVRRIYNTMQLLKSAVEHEGFDIVYQPIYSAHQDKIVSAEALIRLKDNLTMGYISPEEFIPIAEKGGLILKIGEIVLRKVCRFISENKNKLKEYGVQYIEVNLSTIQCMEYGIDKTAIDIMKEFDVEPHWINFEITETAEINSIAIVRKSINELQKSDISFSLDDYGSGNANINYLLELPFEIVKIDKFILWNAFHNKTQMEALESTVAMLHELGIKIVVEGIENQEYLEKMKALGCEYFQGYYFAKPMAEEKYIEYCRERNIVGG